MTIEVRGCKPVWGEDCFVAPNATLVGDVVIGRHSSVWFNAVLRGDVMPIRIGDECNLQDGVIVHGTFNKAATNIGHRVSIGHGAILHGCTIGDEVLVGMGALVMDGARVGANCLLGAGTLVTEGVQIPAGSLVLGRPGKVVRSLRADEIEKLKQSADNYLLYKDWYK